MEELAKIYRVIDRELPYSDREVLLVLDATTGQNAVNQAREFMNAAEITGIVLTKLDGTARGGVVLSIMDDLKIPVKFVGVGEQVDDLQPFDAEAFAQGLHRHRLPAFEQQFAQTPFDGRHIAPLPLTDRGGECGHRIAPRLQQREPVARGRGVDERRLEIGRMVPHVLKPRRESGGRNTTRPVRRPPP